MKLLRHLALYCLQNNLSTFYVDHVLASSSKVYEKIFRILQVVLLLVMLNPLSFVCMSCGNFGKLIYDLVNFLRIRLLNEVVQAKYKPSAKQK